MLIAALCTLLLAPAGSQESGASSAPASSWRLNLVENDALPPGYLQLRIPRADDGSVQTAFLYAPEAERTRRKPLLVFVDGSGAQSQFIRMEKGTAVGVFGAMARDVVRDYHVAACEKRGVEFGEGGRGAGAALDASPEYNEHATFHDRVAEVRRLLDALLTQPTIDPSRVLVIGHSEGAVVAAGVAAADPRVTHVACLSGNGVTQLFDFVVQRRKQMQQQGATPEQIEGEVAKLEAEYREIFADPENTTRQFMGHAFRRWSSFCANPPADTLKRTRARIFLAHGSADESVPIESFDAMVADLIRAKMPNVTVRRYAGYDHGLRPVGQAQTRPLAGVLEEILKWAAE